ncbi:hypothetical protein A2765_00435 [Candidatus Kaiserbacteria bacterium RIFCSPHIGHO2_01_FULL_56_24]|uniref:Uncharacterized protein n=1 Tax=Candidatus Kaiserbacteria bacterium RIFCSPHIGHO2_01_FULL_56_24 TaxID=1798487 RepID=A0A1F6DBN5_9BACT|nr:MAG: hypothetical protein A2765_00435 [Candidatus Kaiserbacteria bacterium RIFCSPHIGHO2_01_FULL_56_24]
MNEQGEKPKARWLSEAEVTERAIRQEAEKGAGLEAIRQLCNGTPEAISMLARRVVVEGENLGGGKRAPRTTLGGYDEQDIHGNVAGSKAGRIATETLHELFPAAKILTNSTTPRRDAETGETEIERHADVAKAELVQKGVPAGLIEVQEHSMSTFTELLELIQRIVENDWHHVVVVGHELQKQRALLMLDRLYELLPKEPSGYIERHPDKENLKKALDAFKDARKDITITFVSAEDVLSLKDPRYKEVVEKARQSPAWEKMRANEERGADQIRSGVYWAKK